MGQSRYPPFFGNVVPTHVSATQLVVKACGKFHAPLRAFLQRNIASRLTAHRPKLLHHLWHPALGVR